MSYKMSKAAALLCCGAMALGLAACGEEEGSAQSTQSVSEKIASDELFTDRDLSGTYDESQAVAIHLADKASTSEGSGVEIQGDTITITKEGVYVLSGTLTDGQVIVDAGEDKVQLVLLDAKIACEGSAAVYVKSADKVFLTMADNSDNTLESNGEFVAIDENDIDATVFSKDDLTLNGTGSLKVTCESGHGIVSKDDLKLTGGTYEISCVLDALSGNDSVRIADGAITIDAGDDGIHSDADLIIVGGTITINDSYEG
ncbi:MAG: carbohydrate-binding domain-containing protein, partial [Lachnospiraceae bacterium]|nr:carbohydrate-binding domain-containing protein [Lachnospiraceae bacterium]